MNSDILKSIFLRKGGEGFSVKIFKDEHYEMLRGYFGSEIDTRPILFSSNDDEILVLTENQILQLNKRNSIKNIIDIGTIVKVDYLSLVKSMSSKPKSIHITLNDNTSYNINIEEGEPFNGLYQVLYYIATQNKDVS